MGTRHDQRPSSRPPGRPGRDTHRRAAAIAPRLTARAASLSFRRARWALLCLVVSAGACSDSVADDLPSDVVATVQGDLVRLSWTDLNESLVVRFPATGVEGAAPERGRGYVAGESLGTGVVVFTGRGSEAQDRPPCTEQVYARWTRDGAGNWSLDPKTVKVTGMSFAIPAAPTALTARLEGTAVALSWTSSAPGSTSVRLVRQRGAAPAGPSSGESVFTGTGTTATDASAELSPNITWHYAAYPCTPCAECGPSGAQAQLTPTLVQSLRAGGFVIWWRHGTATQCEDRRDLGLASETTFEWWKSCDKDCGTAVARQLSPSGVVEAQTIGAAIKAKGIPFGKVVSSEYCRCRESAELMNLGPAIQTEMEVTFFVYEDVIISRCSAARGQLSRPPAAGTNTAIVAHIYEECASSGGPDLTLENGQAAIYRPDRAGGTTLIAKVRYNEWAALL